MKRAVLVMAKAPVAGHSKTRLTPRLTPSVAAELSAAFIRDAVALGASAAPSTSPSRVQSIVAVAPPDATGVFDELVPGVSQIPQVGDNLGQRLAHVMSSALDQGFDQVVAINADGPTLPSNYISEAFDQLHEPEADVVLGPTEDGGYYLIGWKQSHPRLVTDVEMSTPSVLDDTLSIARELALDVRILDPWYDVDEPADLDRLLDDMNNGVSCGEHTRAMLSNIGLLQP